MKLNVVPHEHLNNIQLHAQFHENNLIQYSFKNFLATKSIFKPVEFFSSLKFDTAICPLRILVKIFFILWYRIF